MEEVKKKFEFVCSATEETRLEYMPEFLYFMKLIDILPSAEMIKDFNFFWKVCAFVNSEEYVQIYHSHDLK